MEIEEVLKSIESPIPCHYRDYTRTVLLVGYRSTDPTIVYVLDTDPWPIGFNYTALSVNNIILNPSYTLSRAIRLVNVINLTRCIQKGEVL